MGALTYRYVREVLQHARKRNGQLELQERLAPGAETERDQWRRTWNRQGLPEWRIQQELRKALGGL